MEVRLWLLNKGPFQKAFFSVLLIYENGKKIMNEKMKFLLICSFSWCLLKSKEERNCNIKIARNYYHSERGNNWQLFLVDIPRTIFLWLLYSHVVTSQNEARHLISLPWKLCKLDCYTPTLKSFLDFIEVQTLTFQTRFFFLPSQQCIFLWDWVSMFDIFSSSYRMHYWWTSLCPLRFYHASEFRTSIFRNMNSYCVRGWVRLN